MLVIIQYSPIVDFFSLILPTGFFFKCIDLLFVNLVIKINYVFLYLYYVAITKYFQDVLAFVFIGS